VNVSTIKKLVEIAKVADKYYIKKFNRNNKYIIKLYIKDIHTHYVVNIDKLFKYSLPSYYDSDIDIELLPRARVGKK
jgi:hypothetical protein